MSASDASTELAIFCARMSQRTSYQLGMSELDDALLWACLHAFGETPPLTLVLMGYLPHAERFDLCDPSPHPQVAL